MSACENNYSNGNSAPAFSSHNEQTQNHYRRSSPTFKPNEYAKTPALTTLPPFSSMMQTPFPTTSQSTNFPYDKDAPFTESRHQATSQSQSYAPPLDAVATNLSEKHFYRSAIRSSDLPNPLPTPPYSQELLNARELGRTVEYRSMVIRETVKYFLKMKYWWTSEDYDAMAQMVSREFPDLRDPSVGPGQPDYVRIRAHLSQTARNLRRVAKNQQHRKMIGKPEVAITTTPSLSSTDTEQQTVPSSVVHSMKQDLSSNRMALPSVAHILSKQYLSPSPMTYPMSSASLLPQMMSASSILASPAYQKYLHSSLLQMSPEGMSSLSQKLLSQLATGSYASLPAFGHNPGFPYPVKVETESVLKNEYGPSSSYPSTRTDIQGGEVQQHLQDRESLSPVSTDGSAKDRDYHDGEDLPVHFGSEHSMMHKSSESQRDTSPITHHFSNFSPAGSHTHSTAKDARKRARSNSECEDDIKSPQLGLSDEAELPNPLPVPKYSERVLSANEMGMTKDMRSTIIRETTTFFLNIKYRWTSSDYDRISSMVVSLFPALRDPIASPGYAPTRRVRSDLSMCARNIRRRDVNKITTGYARKKSRAAVGSFVYDPKPSVNVKTEPAFSQYSDLGHDVWEQATQVHDHHDQTFENTAMADSGYGLTAREIARQNLMMMANSADHLQTGMYKHHEESAARSTDLSVGKASESSATREAGETTQGQKGITDTSVPIDASVSHRSYFINENPRSDNVTTVKGASVLDHDQSSLNLVSQEPGDVSPKKESRVVPSEPTTSYVVAAHTPVHNLENVPQSAFGSDPNTGYVNNVSSSYTGFAVDNPINLSSTSDTVNLSLSSRMSLNESSTSSAAYLTHFMNNSANSLETGYYTSRESTTNKSTSEDHTRHSDHSKSSAYSVDVQDDSSCALTFTPLNVEDLRINSGTEGHKSGNVPEPHSSVICTTQTSDCDQQTPRSLDGLSERSKKMAASDHCGKAADFMVATNRGLPYHQSDVSSTTHQSVPGSALPDPLPVPAYSLDLRNKQQRGQLLDAKQQVIKETVSFYLQWKSSKWTSAEYSRVVKMILQQFPELRAVKMLKSMVFFALRNVANRRQSFQTSRYWSQKSKKLQNRPKIAKNRNQNGISKVKSDSDENNQSDIAVSTNPSSITSGKLVTKQSQLPQRTDQMVGGQNYSSTNLASPTAVINETSAGPREGNHSSQPDYIMSQSDIRGRESLMVDNQQIHFTSACTEQQISEVNTAGDSPNNTMHYVNPDISKTTDMQEHTGSNSLSGDPTKKNVPDKLRSSLTRQISLPNPLPVPRYSEQLLNPELDYTLKHHRLQIIRETVKYFLLIKYWWSSRDYERIAEMAVTQFPRLADQDGQSGGPECKKVRRELSMCARNLRRRFVWWDKQSKLKNPHQSEDDIKDPHQSDGIIEDDIKDPDLLHNDVKTELVPDHEREMGSVDPASDSNKMDITLMDSAADTSLKSSGYEHLSAESAACGNHCGESSKQTQFENSDCLPCGYRSNIGRRLSALDHQGQLSGTVPATSGILQHAVRMKKTYVNPDHGNLLQTELSQLWKDGKYFDADLEVSGTKIPTHKLILLAMCPFLQSTLDHTDTKHRIEISMPENSTIEAVDAFLKYLYDGVIHINTDSVHALSKIADMMHIHRLYKHCQDFIESWKKEQQVQEDELNVYRLSLRGQDSDCGQSSYHHHQAGTDLHSAKSERGSGHDLQHNLQDGTRFHNSSSERYPTASTVSTDGNSSQSLNHNYQVLTNIKSVRSERDPVGFDVTARQPYLCHQSTQNTDNMYDRSKIQKNIGGGSCPSTSMGNQRELLQRDVSLKVDRRLSEKIADSYSRWSSGSGHFELQSEQVVKPERSGPSSSYPQQNSSLHYKQERPESSTSSVPLTNSTPLQKQERLESSSGPVHSSPHHKHDVESGLQQSVFPQWWATKM